MPNDLPAPDGAEDRDEDEQDLDSFEITDEDDDRDSRPDFEGSTGFAEDPTPDFEDEPEEDIDTDHLRRGVGGVRDEVGREEVSRVSRALARVGRKVVYRVARLEPSDMPVTELGESAWFTISSPKPTDEDVKEDIRKRFGGGRFRVTLRPLDSTEDTDTREEVMVELGGDPKVCSAAGRAWFLQQHGYLPSDGEAGPLMGDHGGASGGMQMMMQMLQQQQKQMEERMEREREEIKESRRQETSVLAELVRSQSQKGPGMAELLTAVGAVAGALVPVFTEMIRGRREADERRAEREDKKFEELVKRLEEGKDNARSPGEMMQMLGSYVKIIESGAQNQMAIQSKAMEQMLTHSIKRMAEAGDEQGAGIGQAFIEMLRENGGDLLRQGMALIARNQQHPQAAHAQMSQAMQHYQQLQQGQGQQQPQQPQQQQGQGQQAQVPQQQPQMTMQQQAMQIALQSMAQFVMILRMLVHQQPDADTAWVTSYGGAQSMETLFGNAVKLFRERVVASAKAGVICVADWVEGVQEPQLVEAAKEIDKTLEESEEAREWFADFVSKGPWAEDDDSDDDDDGDGDDD